jgi:hypothetical protein
MIQVPPGFYYIELPDPIAWAGRNKNILEKHLTYTQALFMFIEHGGETASTRIMKLRLHIEQLSARKKDGNLK